MKTEQFEQIMNNLESRVGRCTLFLDNVKSTSDLINMTVRDILDLRDFCKSEMGDMDKICNSELYHLLGMGGMTPPQQSSFLKLLKKYLSYRSDIKCLSCNLNDLNNLPNIPSHSTYQMSVLGDVLLKSVDRGNSSTTYAEQKENESDNKTASMNEWVDINSDGWVRFYKNDAEKFFQFCGNPQASKTVLEARAILNQGYIGFVWKRSSDGYFLGKPFSSTSRSLFQKLMLIKGSV